jgi:hypothetical protein
MILIKPSIALLSLGTTVLAQGSPAAAAGGLASLPKGMPGCSNQPAASAASSAGGVGGPASATKPECSDVHFIIGRGSCEPPGPGMLRTLAATIGKQVAGVTVEGIDYPASLNFSNLLGYVSSSTSGASAGVRQITQYSKACPKSKIVVMGVSQVSKKKDGCLWCACWCAEGVT